MDPTREIVDAGAVGAALAVLSGVGAVVGLALLALARRSAPAKRAGLVAICVAFVFPLWVVYNAIEDSLGLDSVAGLLINLALFVVIGIGAGFVLRRLWPSDPEGRRGDAETG